MVQLNFENVFFLVKQKFCLRLRGWVINQKKFIQNIITLEKKRVSSGRKKNLSSEE